MNPPFDHPDLASDLAFEKFAIGQPVPRLEDPRLLRGEGRYTDDLHLPGQLYAAMLRSRHAHGHIRALDLDAARALPGVRLILTAAEMAAAGLLRLPPGMQQPRADGTPPEAPIQAPLAGDKVRFVGEPIACVIADTPQAARDALEAILV
jgi:carbon-monoxide dehydrogenase large subunit